MTINNKIKQPKKTLYLPSSPSSLPTSPTPAPPLSSSFSEAVGLVPSSPSTPPLLHDFQGNTNETRNNAHPTPQMTRNNYPSNNLYYNKENRGWKMMQIGSASFFGRARIGRGGRVIFDRKS